MANPEHLAILEQGVEVWNRWRDENPDVVPDLSAADLLNVPIIGGVQLGKQNGLLHKLKHADFHRTNLSRAYFAMVDLRGAVFSNSDVSGATFFMTDLSEASLIETDLILTTFRESKIDNADFNRAILSQTTFLSVNISRAKHLETGVFLGPSTIDVDTIIKSKKDIPEEFLRGCGLPDEFIDYIPSLLSQPFNYYSCFISHSSLDKEFCARLYNDLRGAHVRTWYFPEDAKWGRSVWGEIDRSINIYDKLVLVCSENSLQSGPVLREIERALNREDREGKNILFPITIDDYVFEEWEHPRKDDVLAKVVGDFRGWRTDITRYNQSFKRLLDALNADE